jgi:hypothetical protein
MISGREETAMPSRIKIIAGKVSALAELNESRTARTVLAALPIESRARRWGEEVYFSIPVQAGLEADARADVEVGEIGYWPEGPAFCIFFGRTPASLGEKPRAASAVNILGKVKGDPKLFGQVKSGAAIRLEKE